MPAVDKKVALVIPFQTARRNLTETVVVFIQISQEETQMSHFSTLRTKIADAEILKASLRDLGINTKTEADVRGYNGQRVRADLVAVLEGEYDLGWSRNSDGSFDLIADLWGVAKKHNQTELINSINQKYAVNKTLSEVKQRGLQNANVQLVVNK